MGWVPGEDSDRGEGNGEDGVATTRVGRGSGKKGEWACGGENAPVPTQSPLLLLDIFPTRRNVRNAGRHPISHAVARGFSYYSLLQSGVPIQRPISIGSGILRSRSYQENDPMARNPKSPKSRGSSHHSCFWIQQN